MRRPMMLLLAVLASLFIAGCGSSGDSAAPPAGGLVVVPGDGIITVSWAMEPGVDYWLFYAPGTGISTSNWTTISGSKSVINVSSPYVATGLSNGTVYSFTLDGRTKGGPGGAGTTPVSAIPRLAGTATVASPVPWTAGPAGAGTVLGTSDLRGVMLGTQYVAVGAGGLMFSSVDGATWSALTSPVKTNLNAAAYAGIYTAVGDAGVILYSTDVSTWTAAASSGKATTNKLNGLGTGAGRVVAVGAGGTIIYSTDGTNWTAAASSGTVTTNDLYAVSAYGNSLWIAVGVKGTILTSPDANTWTAVTSNTLLDLKGVAYGTNVTANAVIFVAVGASGALVSSPDAVTWTAQPAIGAGVSTLNALNYGTQFVAVGSGGGIYTSTDGTNWASQLSATSSNLNAIVHAAYNYAVLGSSGANLLAK